MIYKLIIFFILSNTVYASKVYQKNLAKADYYLFKTPRTEFFLKKSLALYDSIYQKDKKNIRVNNNYGYALYFKAAYTYPRLDKRYNDVRVKLYEKALKITGHNLEYINKMNKQQLAATYLIIGLSEAEISSIKRSLYHLYKAKKYLLLGEKNDPSIHGGAVYIALGRLFSKAPHFLFGDPDKAMSFLKKAQKLKNVVAFLYAADTIVGDDEDYLKLTAKKKKQVKKILNQGLSLSKTKHLTPEEKIAVNSENGIKHKLKMIDSY